MKRFEIGKFSAKSLSYSIILNLFDESNESLKSILLDEGYGNIFIIVDTAVYEHYRVAINNYFSDWPCQVFIKAADVSEQNKTLEQALAYVDFFEDNAFVRGKDIVLLVGGGCLLDIGSFAASIYRRGIAHIRMPTTLLGMVDAGLGIKNGVNLPNGKNRIGTYVCPAHSIIDPTFLHHLKAADITNGLGEIIKVALVSSLPLWQLLLDNRQQLRDNYFYLTDNGINIIRLAIDGLLGEIAKDPWEHKKFRVLDFGHILSPLLESNSNWTIAHGQAVVYECIFSAAYACTRGYITQSQLDDFLDLAKHCNLSVVHDAFLNRQFIKDALKIASQHREGHAYFPYPNGLGHCDFIENLTDADIEQAIDSLHALIV